MVYLEKNAVQNELKPQIKIVDLSSKKEADKAINELKHANKTDNVSVKVGGGR